MKKNIIFSLVLLLSAIACRKDGELSRRDKKEIFSQLKGKWKLTYLYSYSKWWGDAFHNLCRTSEASFDGNVYTVHSYGDMGPSDTTYSHTASGTMEFLEYFPKESYFHLESYGVDYTIGTPEQSYTNSYNIFVNNAIYDQVPIAFYSPFTEFEETFIYENGNISILNGNEITVNSSEDNDFSKYTRTWKFIRE